MVDKPSAVYVQSLCNTLVCQVSTSVRNSTLNIVGPKMLSESYSVFFIIIICQILFLSKEILFLEAANTLILILFIYADCSRFHHLVCMAVKSCSCQQACFFMEALNQTSWLIGLLPTLLGNRVWRKVRGKTEPSSVWGIGCGGLLSSPLMLSFTSRYLLLHPLPK